MKKENFTLILLLTILTFSTAAKIMPLSVQAIATLAAPIIKDTTLIPSADSFRINITVANVNRMLGYQFILSYNTSVLSALNAGSYPPFNSSAVPKDINDTAGYVALQYYTFGGDQTGFSTADPAAIAWIEFAADNYGRTILHLHGPEDGTYLVDIYGQPISHEDVNGSFTNLINIAVTKVTPSRTTVKKGETVNINVTVANQGGATETFSVTAYYDDTPIETKTVTDLEGGTSTTVQLTWDTTFITPNIYTLKAAAEVLQGESNVTDNIFVDGTVTIVRPPGAPIANFTYSPEQPLEGETVTFNASLSTPDGGAIISYVWDFGDDTKALYIGKNLTSTANHIYTTMGTYTVTLNITDSEGRLDATQATITIYRHDIAVLSVTPKKTEVKSGENVGIEVTVVNQGNFSETFQVTLKINETEIEKITVLNLPPGETQTLTFNWNTTGMSEGVYIPSAEATVENESGPEDNLRSGHSITVKEERQIFSDSLLSLAVIAIALIIVVAATLYFTQRRK